MKQLILDGLVALLMAMIPIALIGIASVLIREIVATRRTLSQINMEISRTDREERQHWKRRKKRLLLSLIPFSDCFRKKTRDNI